MGSWRQYVFSIIVCALICGIVSQMVSDTKKKALVRFICGTILAISIFQPLTRINLEEFLRIPEINWSSADYYVAEGQKTASEAQARRIKDSCEAYILDKAKMLGAEVMVRISLNEDLIPAFAEIRGEAGPNVEMELQEILTKDLGIPKENQTWIWNQESNSS